MLWATGRALGVILGKARLKSIGRPKFIEAFIHTILIRPSKVKCSLYLTNSKADLNSWKSDHF